MLAWDLGVSECECVSCATAKNEFSSVSFDVTTCQIRAFAEPFCMLSLSSD